MAPEIHRGDRGMQQGQALRFRDILDTPEKVQMRVREWRNGEEIRQWMVNSHPIGAEEHKRWLRSLKGANKGVFVVYEGRKPVGVVQIEDIDWNHKTADLGLYTICPGKGYGKMIVEGAMEMAFKDHGLRKLTANVLSSNRRAIRLFQRCGWRLEGCQVDQIKVTLIRGIERRVNLLWFGIVMDEWQYLNQKKV